MKFKKILYLLATSCLFLVACQKQQTPAEPTTMPTEIPAPTTTPTTAPTVTPVPTSTPVPTLTPAPTDFPFPVTGESVTVEFTNGAPQGFMPANGWSNGNMFNVTWRADNVTYHDGKMQLIISTDPTPKNNVPYAGGEFRSQSFFWYGRYEVSMKPIKNDGVVSSFFTYTGPSDNNPWDEIDIEFLGKDTTKVQFNYFTNGRGNHEHVHDLGFDATEEFHTYAFEWHPDKIVWFVDGAKVHTATSNIPSTPGKIMMNAWCGTGVNNWLNAFDDTNLPVTAEYEWFSYAPFE